MPKQNESTTTADVAKARPTRFGSYLRNKPVSGSLLQESDWGDLADFLINLDFTVWDLDGLQHLERVLDDIEYVARVSLNEALFKSKKVSSQKASYARKWYQSRKGSLAARRRTLKSNISAMAKERKKKLMAKQLKRADGKPKRQYHTKGHTNENVKSFYDYTKDVQEQHKRKSAKDIEKKKEKARYFIAEEDFKFNDINVKNGDVFTLIGTKLIFEKGNKRYIISDLIPVLQFLKEI
jgi:CRISPR/Cas system CSM-associated protein Csm2 small subunit